MIIKFLQYQITVKYVYFGMIISPILWLLNFLINPALSSDFNFGIYILDTFITEVFFTLILIAQGKKISISNQGIEVCFFRKKIDFMTWDEILMVTQDFYFIQSMIAFKNNLGKIVKFEFKKSQLPQITELCTNVNVRDMIKKIK